MVHALKEARRVLKQDGRMIDVRPLCIDVPLEVVCEGRSASAGVVDLSPDIARDIASDKALSIAFADQIIIETRLEDFTVSFYWNSIDEMKADLDEDWKDEVVITPNIWQRAGELLAAQPASAKLRLAIRTKLGVYKVAMMS
jgi:hypothetical protein